ncbi:phosphate/phosphite/phosphonate ABC transporter substrate-binding protein [Pseudoalteromonas ruthenica]|uniref:phosphate/phosphite/phosphonate ABC transporter substrate-binding protein n=1 Tax=Pseudoalteromonas ruthenica TaxID=151081 RepID=UPI0020164CEB|nr:phosphate/phosphite/phosphonate ABC transporter substrate-binding protein [Pseudoalteromonas ruthenica]
MTSIFNRRDTALILVTLMVLALTSYLIGTMRFTLATTQLGNVIATHYSCNTTQPGNKTQLTLFAPSENVVKRLAQSLCKNTTVSKQYGAVQAFWGGSSEFEVNVLGKGLADLILAKENLFSAFTAHETYGYSPLVGYPSYTAYFIASKEKPRLEKSYFLDKRIGLIEYPTSRSGHIMPKQVFKELDINMNSLDITFVNSHSALRDKLALGEVDIISSYWQQADNERFSANYITAISDNISGSHWFLRQASDNPDLACAIQGAILSQAEEQSAQYFKQAKPYWQCSDSAPATFQGEPL